MLSCGVWYDLYCCSRVLAWLKRCFQNNKRQLRKLSPWEQDYDLAELGQMGLFREYLEMSLYQRFSPVLSFRSVYELYCCNFTCQYCCHVAIVACGSFFCLIIFVKCPCNICVKRHFNLCIYNNNNNNNNNNSFNDFDITDGRAAGLWGSPVASDHF